MGLVLLPRVFLLILLTSQVTSMTKLLKVRGFSLVEMLVYIAILVFVLLLVIQVVTSLVSSQRTVRTQRAVENAAILSIERIGREVRQADTINTSSSVLGTHPGTLVLEGVDTNGAPRTAQIYFSNGKVMLRENGIDLGALTEDSVTVTSLIFRRFVAGTAEGIRTEITLESGVDNSYRTDTFYSSAVVR